MVNYYQTNSLLNKSIIFSYTIKSKKNGKKT